MKVQIIRFPIERCRLALTNIFVACVTCSWSLATNWVVDDALLAGARDLTSGRLAT
jgi:hypothetical protein